MAPTSRTKPPRGGYWIYTHPISGTKFRSPQLAALLYSVRKHEESNGYAITPEADIESALCVNHPFSCSDNPDTPYRRLHVTDIIRGTKVIASFKLAGSPLVSPELAEQRAGICVNCPENVDYAKPCSGICQELIDLVRSMVGGAVTRHDSQLKACRICGCSNAAQVQVPAEFLAKGVNDQMMAQFRMVPNCWKAKEIAAL